MSPRRARPGRSPSGEEPGPLPQATARGTPHYRPERPEYQPSRRPTFVRRAKLVVVDVASNVAIRDRRDAAVRRGTAPDTGARIGRLTSCQRGFGVTWRSDTIGCGWSLQDAVGWLRRFVVCMAWKRSGVRFPLAPLHESPGQRLVAGGGPSPGVGGSVALDPFLDPSVGSLDPVNPFAGRWTRRVLSMADRWRWWRRRTLAGDVGVDLAGPRVGVAASCWETRSCTPCSASMVAHAWGIWWIPM